MVFCLSGGPNFQTELLFMIFTKKNRNYPISGTTDNSDGVSYHTVPKDWMDTAVITQ